MRNATILDSFNQKSGKGLWWLTLSSSICMCLEPIWLHEQSSFLLLSQIEALFQGIAVHLNVVIKNLQTALRREINESESKASVSAKYWNVFYYK